MTPVIQNIQNRQIYRDRHRAVYQNMCYSRKRGRKRGWGTERERNVERLVE
jgi:hypothetical protein